MNVDVEPATVDQIADLRTLYARELDDLIRYEREIRRGQTRSYAVLSHGALIGYGILHGEGENRTTVVEFFLLPQYRRQILPVFDQLRRATNASGIQSRTNDTDLLLLLYETTHDIVPGSYYFRDAEDTHHPVPGAQYRTITLADVDALAPIMTTPEGWPFDRTDRAALEEWIETGQARVLEDSEGIAAVGAIMQGYNPPFAGVGMVVMKRARRRGYGTYLVEELKRETYALGKIPRADCAGWNSASRATLLKAGFVVNARALRGSFPCQLG